MRRAGGLEVGGLRCKQIIINDDAEKGGIQCHSVCGDRKPVLRLGSRNGFGVRDLLVFEYLHKLVCPFQICSNGASGVPVNK